MIGNQLPPDPESELDYQLVPFQARPWACAKCGGDARQLRYCRLVRHGFSRAAPERAAAGSGPEHLDIACASCNYTVYTECLDTRPLPPDSALNP